MQRAGVELNVQFSENRLIRFVFIMKNILLLLILNLILLSCNCDLYKNVHQGSWQHNLVHPKKFYLCYLKDEPQFYDSFPSFLKCPPGFEDYLNFGDYKWIVMKVKLVDVFVNKQEKYNLENPPLFVAKAKIDTHYFNNIRYFVYPYCGKKMKRKVINYYQEKKLVYFADAIYQKTFTSDGSLEYYLFTTHILVENKKHSKKLFSYPLKTDL